jgi:hypothetical protein
MGKYSGEDLAGNDHGCERHEDVQERVRRLGDCVSLRLTCRSRRRDERFAITANEEKNANRAENHQAVTGYGPACRLGLESFRPSLHGYRDAS